MKRGRIGRSIIISFLILLVIGMSVAFAALSQELKINASGKIKNGTWSILFDNLNHSIVGTAEDDDSSIAAGTTLNLNAIMYKPGDKVTYTFEVLNNGTIDAVLQDIVVNGAFEDYSEIKYSLSYNNDLDYGMKELSVNDFLNSNARRTLKLEIWFDNDATVVSDEDRVLDFSISIVYIQKN